MTHYNYKIEAGSNEALILDTLPVNMSGTDNLRLIANRLNSKWFDKDTVKFFGSKFRGTTYANRYFVSSEQDPSGSAWEGLRRYSVREFSFSTTTRKDGREIVLIDIETVGEMGQYRNATAAVVAISALIHNN